MQLKILLIDDQPESVASVVDEVSEKLAGVDSMVVDFDHGESSLREYQPHVVVLDLLKTGTDGHNEPVGKQVLDFVWNRHFCPLILYSAVPEQIQDDIPSNPFVKVVKKGSGSEELVLKHIKEFEPHIAALDGVGREIGILINRALRDVAPRIFAEIPAPDSVNDFLVRSARRQVAAAMDEALSSGGPDLQPWEHYLCPPCGTQLLTGDLVQAVSGSSKDPASFFVVLTPSCDLAFSATRKPKVNQVLVAGCGSVTEFLRDIQVSAKKHKDKLIAILRQGYGPSHLPLPALKSVFPAMVADFRTLKLIELSTIGNTGTEEYRRVASVDNPFRELVSWAYMHVAARPGLPERDCGLWADEMFQALETPAQKKSDESN